MPAPDFGKMHAMVAGGVFRDLRVRFAPPQKVPGLVIRPATAADLDALEWEGEFIHFRQLFADTWLAMQRGQRLILVAEKQHYMIGQVFMQFQSQSPMLADGHSRGYLYAFRVKPDFQNLGIGTALLSAAENTLRKFNYRVGVIAVAKDNPRAQSLYERHGYTVIGDDPGQWTYRNHLGEVIAVDEPCWILEKKLVEDVPPARWV